MKDLSEFCRAAKCFWRINDSGEFTCIHRRKGYIRHYSGCPFVNREGRLRRALYQRPEYLIKIIASLEIDRKLLGKKKSIATIDDKVTPW